MRDLIVLRVDRKVIPLEQRGAFAEAADHLARRFFDAARRREEDVAVLNTCERFEIYLASPSVAVDDTLRAARLPVTPRRLGGDDALRHLFRVAAGLESRIPGEPHVLGQVRAALVQARRHGTAGKEIVRILTAALACGRRVRAAVPFGTAAAGYTSRAVDTLRAALGELRGRHVLVVGSGALAAEIALSLRDAGVAELTIAGRHLERAGELARRCGARAVTLAELHALSTRIDAIVSAVASADPVITVETVRECRVGLLIDLGASPNVDPLVRLLPGVRVCGLEDLGGTAVLADALDRAAGAVERELQRFLATRATRPPGAAGRALRNAS